MPASTTRLKKVASIVSLVNDYPLSVQDSKAVIEQTLTLNDLESMKGIRKLFV